jgi:hypothetical protein
MLRYLRALEGVAAPFDALYVHVRCLSQHARAQSGHRLKRARVATNHSTICPGLPSAIAWLQQSSALKTIVPGRMFNAKASREHFSLHVAAVTPRGFRLMARVGQTVQEVYVVTETDISQEDMQTLCDRAVSEAVLGRRIARLASRRVDALEAQAEESASLGDVEEAGRLRAQARALARGAWSPSLRSAVRPAKSDQDVATHPVDRRPNTEERV